MLKIKYPSFCCCFKTFPPEESVAELHINSHSQKEVSSVALETLAKVPSFADATSLEEKNMPAFDLKSDQLEFHKHKSETHLFSKTVDLESEFQNLHRWLIDFKNHGTYADFKKIHFAKRNFCMLNKSFARIKNKTDSQIEIQSKIAETLDNLMKSLLKSPEVIRANAVAKFVAKRKGEKVRNENVTTEQMYSYLLLFDFTPCSRKELLDISRALARQINEITENQSPYLGKNFQLKAKVESYPFYSLENNETKLLTLDFFCWFELNERGTEIELFIVPPNSHLGKGVCKNVSKAESIRIPFKVEPNPKKLNSSLYSPIFIYQRKGIYAPKVLIEPVITGKNLQEREHSEKKSRQKIEREVRMHQDMKYYLPNAELISPLKETKPLVLGSSGRVLYSQDFYEYDLDKVINSGIILDSTRILNLFEIFKVIHDTALTLEYFHKTHKVHQDVKPQNIFIRKKPFENVKGVLGDYDLIETPGVKFHDTDPYFYWDALSNQGFLTPFTDVYGLTLSLALSILPGIDNTNLNSLQTLKNQEAFLVNAIKTIYPDKTIPCKYNNHDSISWFENTIKDTIKNAKASEIKRLQDILNNFYAIKGTLSLLVEVLLINHKLSKSFAFTSKPVFGFIRDGKDLDSVEKANSSLSFEIETYFMIPGVDFYSLPGWNKLKPSEKIRYAKKILSSRLESDTVETEDKLKLEKCFQKIEAREAALEYMNNLSALSLDEQRKHPLYMALVQPTVLHDREMAYYYLSKEIKNVMINKKELFLHFSMLFENMEDPKKRVRAIKNMLQMIRKNNAEKNEIKQNADEVLSHILLLEKVLNFVIETRNDYIKKINDVMKNSMSMRTFITKLNEIRGTLILPDDLEEKKG